MNAAPLLTQIVEALAKCRLEAILIGNAGAALHGAPVTTVDFDFMFRATATNLKKLRSFAKRLQAIVLKPYYPASGLYRVMNDENGLQVDFMSNIHGIRSFASLRARARRATLGQQEFWLASLEDIILSKRAAARARDKAVLPVLEQTLNEKQKLHGSK